MTDTLVQETHTAQVVQVNKKKNNNIIFVVIGVVLLVLVLAAILIAQNNSNSDSSDDNQATLLPANTCPESLSIEGRPTAVYQGRSVDMSAEVYQWVQDNCTFGAYETPELKNLGINASSFAAYDEMTGRAGAFVFDKVAMQRNYPLAKIIFEFGSTLTSDGEEKIFPEITYSQVDADTDVIAMVEGEVFKIRSQPESDDFALEIRFNDKWMIIYDHVTSLEVEEGDSVEAGDILGKVSLNGDQITGFTEIQIKEGDGRISTINHCPLNLLAENLKADYSENFMNLMQDWETFYADENIYDQEDQFLPGCVIESYED